MWRWLICFVFYSYFLRQTVGRRKILSLPGNTPIPSRWLRICTCLDSSWKSSKRTCATASLILVITRKPFLLTVPPSTRCSLVVYLYIIMKRIISIKQMSRLETRERESFFRPVESTRGGREDTEPVGPIPLTYGRMDGQTDPRVLTSDRLFLLLVALPPLSSPLIAPLLYDFVCNAPRPSFLPFSTWCC